MTVKWLYVMTALLLLVVFKTQAQTFTYAYDELGRLSRVVDLSATLGSTTTTKSAICCYQQHNRFHCLDFYFNPQQWSGGSNCDHLRRRFRTTPSQTR